MEKVPKCEHTQDHLQKLKTASIIEVAEKKGDWSATVIRKRKQRKLSSNTAFINPIIIFTFNSVISK